MIYEPKETERAEKLFEGMGDTLIRACLREGLYPSWDAANPASVRLAEKLGYEFSHTYVCYAVEGGA